MPATTVRAAIMAVLAPTNQFSQLRKAPIADALLAAGFDRAEDEAWVSGALAVLVTEGDVVEDPYSTCVSYYRAPQAVAA